MTQARYFKMAAKIWEAQTREVGIILKPEFCLAGFIGPFEWQCHAKNAAFTLPALESEASAVAFNNFFAQAEPYS